jgi:hypothetical protein
MIGDNVKLTGILRLNPYFDKIKRLNSKRVQKLMLNLGQYRVELGGKRSPWLLIN